MGIVLEGISKSFDGRPVLADVSCEIGDGEIVSFLAPTGAGKTTLLRIAVGIERPDAGRVLYDGVDVTDLPVQRRSVAMVYQWFVNYPSMTVAQNIAAPIIERERRKIWRDRLTRAQIRDRVVEVATRLKIAGHLGKRPDALSGGQQQRLAIARALAKEADWVFLDEPMTNLDYKLQEELRAELKELFVRRERGAVVFATPQPIEALNLSTNVGFLREGRLLQFGPVREVYQHPCCADVGRYFSHPSMNLFAAERDTVGGVPGLRLAGDVRLPLAGVAEKLPDDGCLVGVRAHELSLADAPGRVPIAGTVELAEVVGSDSELHLRHRDETFVVWERGIHRRAMGGKITAFLDPRRLYFFDRSNGALIARTHPEAA